MRRCGKQYGSEDEALRSKAGQGSGVTAEACRAGCGRWHLVRPKPAPVLRLASRTPIGPVSDRRRRENRERAAMADQRWPDRRDGTVMCECGRPECDRRADDGHEILTRARGGSITDPANVKALARECHQEIQLGPDWAYRAGLLKHSGLCCQGRDVCERYTEGGQAA